VITTWLLRLGIGALVILAVAAVIVVPRFLTWRSAIERRLLEDAIVVQTRGGLIEYADVGHGFPLLMLHGTPGGYDQILKLVQASGGPGPELRLIVPSRPGYLRTPLASGRSPQQQAKLFAALLDKLGIDKAFVLGASGGGPSALQFALQYPERCAGLILEEAVTRKIETRTGSIPPVLTDLLIYLFRDQAIAAVQASEPSDPNLSRLGSALIDTLVPMGKRVEGDANDREYFASLPDLPLQDITCPTLILHGTLDKEVPLVHALWAHERIVGSRLIKIEGGDHGMVASRYKELNVHIRSFLIHHQG